ncbi:MAG: isocitrate lyase/phosphoenolpyruvate mutase family protein [Phycisphaeraceae bacterium]|nr:isocitrate lyase/phosphoenolpyruvate mutase family protein [Phycisphaeraceae bacterium]
METPGRRFRALMDKSCLPVPGAFNALVARAVARAGFPACYVSGAATTVCAGVPDIGLLTLDHFARIIREAADASGLPILADADTGFGEEEMVRRTVVEYSRAGAAALHIEDQVFPKRCGHLDGKTLIPIDQAVSKITWAAEAAKDLNNNFVICARTDARGVDGFDAAIDRARAYANAGADMIFPEGLTTEDEFARFAHAMTAAPKRPYLLANMTEFGKTPIIPLARFADMGYHCVIFPVSLLRIAMGAVTRALETLRQDGSVQALLADMQSRKDLYELIGYTPGTPWEYPVQ